MTALDTAHPHTAPVPRRVLDAHEHGWDVESRHVTSEGTILYVVCTACGARRVDLAAVPQLPPVALTVTAARRAR